MDRDKLLDELIHLAEKKEISYTKKYLEKQSEETLEKILARHREKELDELNEAIVDTAIGKFDEFMKSMSIVSKSSKLGRKLQDKKLFRQDLKSFIGLFTPLLPYVGILEGVVCVVNEIINNNDSNDVNKSSKSETEQGSEQTETDTEPNSNNSGSDVESTKL